MGKSEMDTNEISTNEYFDVLEQIKKHIVNAQYQVLTAANVEKNILYWKIGKVIVDHSTWGNKFVENLSKDLRREYP